MLPCSQQGWRGRAVVRCEAPVTMGVTMRRVLWLSSISFLLAVAFAPTELEAQKPVVLHGAGGGSCGKYVQVYDAYKPYSDGNTGDVLAWQATANYWQYEQWIEGYLFGVDSWNRREIRSFDEAGMQLWIYNYCQKHPIDPVANAALAFYRELGGPTPTGGNR